MGVLRFCLGPYLAVISKRQQVARLLQRYPVFVVQSVALVPIFHLTGLPPQKTREELRFRTEFLSFISSRDFYFAYNYDLGQSLQINAALSAPVVDCEHDSKFVWNHHHNRMWCGLTAGHDVETYSTVQVINGSMAARSLILDSRKLEIALIARRSRVFAGTRYLKRGVDSGGNVANEVEVEQVVHDWTKSEVYSFVQVRGSIPLMWRQEPSRLKPKPPIECRSQTDAGHNSCKLHFSSLISRYGSPVMVMNLVRSPSQDEFPRDGTQRRHTGEIHIGQRFRRVVSDLNRTLPDPVKLEYTECDVKLLHGKSKAAMFLVLSRLGEQCVRRHWFYHASDGALGAPYTIQVGVCRTNCIDCLDRTNVAQFVMGRVMLAYQLAAMGVLSDPRTMLVQLPFTKGNPLVGVNSRTLQSILYPVPVPTFRVPNVYDPVLNETESTDSSHEVVDSPVMGTSWVAGRIYEMIFGGDDENPSTSRLPNEVWKSVASCSEDAEPEAKLLGVVADLYMCMGDLLALQYGGSVAHKHLQLDSSSMQKKGKELITSITRHCVNNFVDADRQSVMNVSIGVQSAMNRMLQSSNAIEVDRWLHHCLSRNAPTLQRDWGSRALHKYALLYGLALVNKHETGAAFSPATVVGQLAQAVKGLTEVCSCCQGYRKSLFLKTNIIELAKLREGRMLIPHTQGTRHASLTSDSSSGSTSEAVKPPPLEYTSFRSLQSAAFAVRVSLDVSATSALGAMRRSGTRGASRSATDDALTRMQRQHRSGTDGSEGATSRRHLVTAPKRAASLDFVWFPGPERTQLHVAAAVPSLYTDESRITWRSVFLRMLGTVHPAPLKPVTHWVSHARCGSWRGRPKIHVCKSSGRIVRPGVRWLAVADVHITPLQPPLIRRTTQEPPTFSNVTLRRSGLVPISSTSRPYRSLYATKGKYLQDA
ncbi:MAG: uncharacterized protein KVP18_003615 [Porospora cf. gigantea A]|uniref:uncharacterized protein n=1 Tax=Porospora cf. gigantea A TaxID=2853593 RepID=UPI00355AA66E|nr:MAG: hypothetical protein KVP18_003615 [Porospora cf. gigantea A]